MEKIKLQKYFSNCGVLSRRAAETEIQAGRVYVNGAAAGIGDRVDPVNDIVTWRGKRIVNEKTGYTYIMLNKPAGVVTTMRDEEGRQCVAHFIADIPSRVYPVGRLDMYSDGLLLLTDDGELTNKLTHPSHETEKIYRVTFRGQVRDEDLTALAAPMTITESDGNEYALAPIGVKLIARHADTTVAELTLHEGRNRQIRRMCEKLGLKIVRLTRISEAGVTLGSLPCGKWRALTDDEIVMISKNKG